MKGVSNWAFERDQFYEFMDLKLDPLPLIPPI